MAVPTFRFTNNFMSLLNILCRDNKPYFFFFFARNALFKSDSLQKDPRGEAAEFALNKQTKSLNFCLFILYLRLVSLMAMPVD